MTRGSIGIQLYKKDDPRNAPALKVSGASEGVFVDDLAAGGPSEKAGMKPGDVIVSINGQTIHEGDQLIGIVTGTPVGSTLDIGVLRDHKRENLKVVVGNLAQIFPAEFGGGRQEAPSQSEGTTVSFGMTINPLTDRQRETQGIKEKGGVMVSEVEPGSFAEDVGLVRNDLILEINRHPVNSVEDIKKIQATLKPGDPVMFRVMRHDPRRNEWASVFLPGTLPNQMH